MGLLYLTESAAIIQYLSETFTEPELMAVPRDAESRAALNEWCYFIATELDAGSLYVMRRHVGLEHVYGAAPKAVEAARNYFMENAEAMAPRIAQVRPISDGRSDQRRRYSSDDLSRLGGHGPNSSVRHLA